MDSKDLASIGIESRDFDASAIRDIAPEVLGQDGRMRVLPASYWQSTTPDERALFGHRQAVYSFPTTELVTRLAEIIDGRSAIEIGAGNGVLAQALGIPATDSHQQQMPRYKMFYQLTQQPTITYGPNVEQMHASRAVRHYKPQVVIGCWVTHKWEASRQHAEGNEDGIDEADIMANCDTYVLVGNEHTHRHARMLERHPSLEYPDWLYSRAVNGKRNMIAVWNRRVPRR